MRKLLSLAAMAAAAVATPHAASAATCVALTCNFTPGDDEFTTAGDTTPPITGPVSATIGRTAVPLGVFTDTYRFIVDVDGTGSGSISTSLSGPDTDINFLLVTINGQIVPIIGQFTDVEFSGISGVSVIAGMVNELVISGESAGLGSYGGNLTFTPAAVPEPSAWALIMLGLGSVGYVMRRRRKLLVLDFA